MTNPTPAHSTHLRHAEHLSRDQLLEHGARFCTDCHSRHEYALVDDDVGLAAYRMEADRGRRVAEATDAESAAQLGLLIERVL